jgi:hypothetical protein
LKDYIFQLQSEFRAQVQREGLKYGRLFDFVHQKAKESKIPSFDANQELNEKEFREALRVLEDDNIITLNGH